MCPGRPLEVRRGAFTHVLTYDGGVLVTQLGSRSDISVFSNPLHHFNGDDQRGLSLSPLPADKTYDEMLNTGELSTEFIQAGGLPDAMTVEIRKPGGRQWVRYTVGHPQCQPEPIDVPIDGGVRLGVRTGRDRRSELVPAMHGEGHPIHRPQRQLHRPGSRTRRPAQGRALHHQRRPLPPAGRPAVQTT